MTTLPVDPTPRVLAAGHLSPGVLVLRLIDSLRQIVLPIAIAVVARSPWLAIVAAVLALLGLVFAVARYVTFRYRLDEHELSTREGILERQERRIPVDRIQDLSFESTVLRRLLGLVVVSVETASGKGAEARLDSLTRRDAELLRAALIGLRSARAAGAEGSARAAEPRERVLQRTGFGELILLGMTSNRAGAIVVAVLGVLELADEFGLGRTVGGTFGAALDRLASAGSPVLLLFFLAIAVVVLVLGALVATIAAVVVYGDFQLSERSGVISLRHGLLTRRSQSLPRRRIQRVLLEANPLRRLCDAVVVRADSAGADASDQESARRARDVVVPLCSSQRAEILVPHLLPGLPHASPRWHRVSSRLILRLTLEGVLLALVLWAVLFPVAGKLALATILLPFITGCRAALAYHNLGFARLPGHVAFRLGVLTRIRAFIPLRKVQGVALVAGPIDRLFGLTQITVYVAGGSPTRLGHLPRAEAEQLRDAVVREAAASSFVW